MKYVLAVIASLFLLSPTLTFADSQTTITTAQGLTDEQKALLAAEAAKMVTENPTGKFSTTKAKEFQQWVDLGTAIGSGLASTAKELGIAANDFVKTPVGKLTAGLIVWHFVGSSAIHLVFGSLWLLLVGSFWYSLYRRTAFKVTVTDYETGKGPNGAKRTTIRSNVDLTEGQSGTFIVGGLIIAAVGVVTLATF